MIHREKTFKELKLYFCIACTLTFIAVIRFNIVEIQRHSAEWLFGEAIRKAYVDKWKSTNRSLTVVTAFFNIGSIRKGTYNNVRLLHSYREWINAWRYIQNPLIIFTDNKEDEAYFKMLINDTSLNHKIIRIDRQDLWSFQIISEIKKIYSNSSYPKHYPNTVNPNYTSVTHSKLTLLKDSITKNYFQTDYYCWVDIGYFRNIASRKTKFWLEVPADFNKTKIGVTKVYNVRMNNIAGRNIIANNHNWIGAGLFLGTPSIIIRFEKLYKKAVLYYLKSGLMNVDQQILYAMYTEEEQKKNPVDIQLQLYIPGQKEVLIKDPWFYLGYVMYHPIY